MKVQEVYIKDKDERLEQALADVAAIEPDFEKALLDYADAETNYRIAKSEKYLAAEGTEKAREAQSILAVAKLLRERNRAEAVKDFLKAKLKDRQDAVSARQSLLSAEVKTNQRF
jgi:hypothetical protein